MRTALSSACLEGKIDYVDLLLKIPDIEINRQNLHGFNSLLYAASRGKIKIIKCLLEYRRKKAKLRTQKLMKNDIGHRRSPEQSSGCLKNILDINLKNINGDSALILACRRGFVKVVQILTEEPDCDLSGANKKVNVIFFCPYQV